MKNRILLGLAVVLLFAPAARADVLTGLGGNNWSAWVPAAESRSTFWDNTSWDGANCNVGFWVSGRGGCTSPTTPLLKDFYTGSPNTSPFSYLGGEPFVMTTEPNTYVTGTAIVGVSAASAVTEFGWFWTGDGVLHPIATGATQGTITPFSILVPSGTYGFYLQVSAGSPAPAATFYSNLLSPGAGRSQFSAFDLGGGRWAIGIEDLQAREGPGINSDYDFNDYFFIVESRSTPVPEPASVFLVGLGLIGTAAVVRRRARRQ